MNNYIDENVDISPEAPVVFLSEEALKKHFDDDVDMLATVRVDVEDKTSLENVKMFGGEVITYAEFLKRAREGLEEFCCAYAPSSIGYYWHSGFCKGDDGRIICVLLFSAPPDNEAWWD